MYKNEGHPLNDVYSLCASYFQIEMFNPEKITENNDIPIVNYVVGSEDLSETDVVGKEIRHAEKEYKVHAAIDAQR